MSTIKHTLALALALSVGVAHSGVADAQDVQEAPAPVQVKKRSKARFSGKRLAAEIVTGAVVGSAAAYGTYKGLGGDGIGPALAAIGVNFLVTPLAEWGVGNVMGGEGSLSWTYMGGLLGFSASAAPPEAALAVAVICLPITSGLMYELSSNKWAVEHELQLSVTPTTHGATAGVSFTY